MADDDFPSDAEMREAIERGRRLESLDRMRQGHAVDLGPWCGPMPDQVTVTYELADPKPVPPTAAADREAALERLAKGLDLPPEAVAALRDSTETVWPAPELARAYRDDTPGIPADDPLIYPASHALLAFTDEWSPCQQALAAIAVLHRALGGMTQDTQVGPVPLDQVYGRTLAAIRVEALRAQAAEWKAARERLGLE